MSYFRFEEALINNNPLMLFKTFSGHVLVLDTLPISPSDLELCPKLKVIDISRMVSSLIMDLHLATD